ncbi:MAG: UbiD family decarboxylase [Cereibacter changlensis]
MRSLPVFPDLRSFTDWCAAKGQLLRIVDPVSLQQQTTAVADRVLRAGGPVLRFDHVTGPAGRVAMPLLANLFGTRERVAAGLGLTLDQIPELGAFLAALRTPAPVAGMRDALSRWPHLQAALNTRAKVVRSAEVQEVVQTAPDMGRIPVPTCWPGDAGPLITWPVVLTRPHGSAQEDTAAYNAGVYRAQVIGHDRLIMRWLAHRGGAGHHRTWERAGQPMPVALALGCDPALLLGAALPLPEQVSELTFSGVLRGARTPLVAAKTVPLMVPANAEIILEGWVHPGETAPEGPFGDHTGYYNSVDQFPVLRLSAITHRRDPVYLTTHTGRPPDEPSVIGEVFNELALPVFRQQIPELRDLWLPPAACSYRIAILSIDKRYPGQARRVMLALWGMLAQFSYTKMVIVVDADINPRDWNDVAWAMATRMDPSRDVTILDRTPMDYLDFASPEPGLAGKIGIDATNKIGPETTRDWGEVMAQAPEAEAFAEQLLARLGQRR